MTEAVPDHTLDELFQLLVHARDIPPATAKKQIWEFLQLDKLQIDYHIRAGTRTTQPEKKFRAHPYEVVPPEGITAQVNFQSWGNIFGLWINDGQLVVEPKCSLDYPWDAYSFTIANWSLVNELWPPKPPQPSSERITNQQPSSESATKPPRRGSADFWIDVVAPKEAWRNLPGKQLHSLAAKHIDGLNVENEREAKKQSQKPPPKINCPGVRAFQTAVANRHRRSDKAKRNKRNKRRKRNLRLLHLAIESLEASFR